MPDPGRVMGRRVADVTSFTAGVVIGALGVLLLLDNLEAIDMKFAHFAPAVTATAGAILLARGLSRSRER